MGIWDKVKGQLRSVIEWENPSPDCLFEVWTENGDEIKNASKLIVKPGQGVLFLYEGKVEAVHLEPGLFNLDTANIPFITTIIKFMQAFESEHKVGIYFFWLTEQLDQKWGTRSPITYDDPVYKFPVSLKAFGNYTMKLTEPEQFFVNIVGGKNQFTISELREVINGRLLQPLTDTMAEGGYSFAEIDKNRDELSAAVSQRLGADFTKLGFEMTDFRIESTTFDEDTQGRIARISDITAEAEAARRAGVSFANLQQLEALRDAAKNPGGAAGAGVGIGAGVGLGQVMAAGMMQGQPGAPAQGAASSGQPTVAERLTQLKQLLDQELITQEDFDSQKAKILSEV